MGFTTKAIHTPYLRKDSHGALNFPVYDSVTFEFESAEELEAAFRGQKPRHVYSRITNPTVEHLEQKIKNVSGAVAVVAVSSGMAAIANTIMSIAQKGDNIITTKYIFGNTYSLFKNTLGPWGLDIKYADFLHPENLTKLIDANTRAIFFETITNPQLEVADIKALSEIARKHNILLLCDTTMTPVYLFNSRAFGVDIELLSSTKYISGGATSVGGLIIDNGTYDWRKNPKLEKDAKQQGPLTLVTKLKREVFRNFGACLSPHNAYLQSVGLETLALRADRSCATTLEVARFLEKHEKTKKVNFPGLESSPFYSIAKKQFGNKCGSVLTFELLSREECFKFLNKLKIIRRATNLNDNKTLALHPASTIFCEYNSKLKLEMGVPETLIRLAVGIEEPEDIIADIKQALED
ncbi:aminotransferase class V-fold PLP-dependent enzyme [bacterium]|nr:aminotransferase class V-fold PLP-dependent enzyme [bacterium]MBU4122701.1 aminotransferase class V-fold PLP-dependent enzyme [bacterium]